MVCRNAGANAGRIFVAELANRHFRSRQRDTFADER
jgi:hypothetical protein